MVQGAFFSKASLLMLWLYRLLFPLVLIVVSPRYLLRMRRRGGYQAHFGHRFGRHPRLPAKTGNKRRVWLQAVSVGEMLAIEPLLDGLIQRGVEVYLTTTTSTGFRIASDRYLGKVLGLGYFPIDWWPFSATAWDRIDPDLVVLTEGERWPEHVAQANARRVPVVVINARMSDRGYRRMRAFPFASSLMLGGIDRVFASSQSNAERFLSLGVPASRIAVTGNLKLDVAITRLDPSQKQALRQELGLGEGLVLLGSSTWPGEETALLDALREARSAGLSASLLLVPRHAERRGEIEAIVGKTGLSWHLRSRGAAPGPLDVAIADTTGELRRLAQLADLIFVGKSLPPHTEGQTPVEAAVLGKPIVFGPGMSNFREIAAELVACGGAVQAPDGPAAARALCGLLADPARRESVAKAALGWHAANAGAVARTLEGLAESLGKS